MLVSSPLLRLKRWGTGFRGLTRGLATLLQGNQEPLMVKTMMEDPQVNLG